MLWFVRRNKVASFVVGCLFVLGILLGYLSMFTSGQLQALTEGVFVSHPETAESKVIESRRVQRGEQTKNKSPYVNILGNKTDDICSIESPWSPRYPIANTVTDLSFWDFTQRIDCPKLDLTPTSPSRQKVVLDCSGQPRMKMEPASNKTDVFQVEFGDKCLADVIEHCCTDLQPVPNVIHYIWYSNQSVGFFQYLSYISVMRFMKPCLYLFHGEHLPYGPYWDYFVSLNPNVIHVKRPLLMSVYGQKLAFKEHGSDVMRIEALQVYGGVYLDWDEVLLRPLEPLRRFMFTMGLAGNAHFGNQVIIAARNATFLNLWHQTYKNYTGRWADNSLFYPFKLSKRYPDLIHVEGHNFTRPSVGQFPLLFKGNYDWSTNYAMHLYIRFYKTKTDLDIIRSLNTTIGAVCRHILLGNKELCRN